MSRTLLVLATLGALLHHVKPQDNYDFVDYPDPDWCITSYYDNEEYAGECHHSHFPQESVRDRFGDGARVCCEEHGYLHVDNCEDRPTYRQSVCGGQGRDPTTRAHQVHCPERCKNFTDLQDFRLDSSNNLVLNTTSPVTVFDYCLGYICLQSSQSWELVAQACVCPSEELIQGLDRRMDEGLTRCCPETMQVGMDGNLTCVVNSDKLKSTEEPAEHNDKHRTCDVPFKKVQYNRVTVTNDSVSFPESLSETAITVTAERDSLEYCVGVTENKMHDAGVDDMYQPTLMYCSRNHCSGVRPCFSTCCYVNEVWNDSMSMCTAIPRGETLDKFPLSAAVSPLLVENLERSVITTCPSGMIRRTLAPEKRCRDQFAIGITNSNKTYVKLSGQETMHPFGSYCLYLKSDMSDYTAQVCVPKPSLPSDRVTVYPYILLVSSLCLLVTLFVYIKYDKELVKKNSYPRLMRHMTFTLLMAFVILTINQLQSFVELAPPVCVFSGFAIQYFFLAFFLFMTLMALELSRQLQMKPTSMDPEVRYRFQLGSGYCLPLFISFVTLIVELTADPCSPFKPRFGEIECFFAERGSKFVLFFLPILIMTVINTAAFVWCVYKMCAMKNTLSKELGLKNNATRSEKVDRMLIYVKLFLGMGPTWIFEIMAGMTSEYVDQRTWVFTDVLNMLQGVFVFVIFVCKRNVLNVIMGRREGADGVSTTKGGRIIKRFRNTDNSGTVDISLHSRSDEQSRLNNEA